MAYAEKRGKKWRGMYRDLLGARHEAGRATTKKEALALAHIQELKIRGGTWADPRAGAITFSVYWEEMWMPNRIIEATTRSGYDSYYRTDLKPTFGDMELRKITRGHVQRWVVDMQKRGLAPRTIQAKFLALKVCLAGINGVSAINDNLIATNPCKQISLPKVPRRHAHVYTLGEVDLLMERIEEWWRPLIAVATDTGMRWGELQGLHVADVADGKISVERTVVELTKKQVQEAGGGNTQWMVKDIPKDGEERTLTLSPHVAAVVESMIRTRELFPGDRLFAMHDRSKTKMLRTEQWPNGRPTCRSHFRTMWRDAHEDDIEFRKVHAMRGTMISWLILGGADLGSVMGRAGHSRMSTTQQYFDRFADSDQRALGALARIREAHDAQ